MNQEKSNAITVFIEIDGVEQKVGRLAYKNKDVYFEYDKQFLLQGIEISPFMLPLKEGVIKCEDKTFDGLFGVFADSLPDGWGRLLIDRHVRKIGKNPYDLTPLDRLLFVGRYGMGALRYEPDNSNDLFETKNITLDEIAELSQEILSGDSDEMVEALLALNGSSSGARPKVMVQYNEGESHIINDPPNLQDGYQHWMIKFPSSTDQKEVGTVEYAYALMAKYAGIKMPDVNLFKTEKQTYFGCKRFDRDENKKIHSHSLAGLIHSDFRLPSLDYDDILNVTMELTKDHRQVEECYRLACFNALSKNKDDHAKNFSFVLIEKQWKLSPAYDLTFSSGPNGFHSTMVLGEDRSPGIKDLLKLGEKHSIVNRDQIVADVVGAIAKWEEFASIASVPMKTIKLISKELDVKSYSSALKKGTLDNAVKQVNTQVKKTKNVECK